MPAPRVLHYIRHWLPVSEQFIAAPIQRSECQSIVVSKTTPSVAAFPHPNIYSLDPIVRHLPGAGAKRLGTSGLVAALALRNRTDVVHVHFGYEVRDLVPLLGALNTGSVLSLHGHDVTALPDERPGHYEGVFDAFDVVIVPSEFLAARAVAIGASRDQIRIVPSGVDRSLFRPTPLDLDSKRIVFVGRFVEKKGIDDLVAAWPLVKKAVPDAQLHLLGYGPLASLVPNLPDVVVEAPDPSMPRVQVQRAIQSARVVVTPSKVSGGGDCESLLLVNLEAQASGRPLVTTRHGGIPEFVSAERTALLVDEADPDGLASSLIRLLQDRRLAEQMSAAGPAWVEQFDVDVQTRKLDGLYRELASRRSTGRLRPRARGRFERNRGPLVTVPPSREDRLPERRKVIAICIATFRRPDLLDRLLRALPEQIDDVKDRAVVSVIVVDNDPDGTGRPVVENLPQDAQPEYFLELRPGIAAARNAGVRNATGADFVLFIDDDEIPRPGWLRTLLDVQEATGAPVVTGPVVPVYAEGTPKWIQEGHFYDCRRPPTGTPISVAATNNTLVDQRVLPSSEPFSDQFGQFWGGDDTLLFMSIERDGGRQIWADEAVVEETVHPNRMRPAWLLQRAFKAGNTQAISEKHVYGWGSRSVVRLGKALGNIGYGPVLLARSGSVRCRVMWAGMRVARGLGMLAGLGGVVYSEYKR